MSILFAMANCPIDFLFFHKDLALICIILSHVSILLLSELMHFLSLGWKKFTYPFRSYLGLGSVDVGREFTLAHMDLKLFIIIIRVVTLTQH